MIELKNCTVCGKVFPSNGFTNTCPLCREKDEADFKKIRDYLYIHPCSNMYEVSVTLGMPIHQIKRYLREDRLEIIEKNNSFLHCEICKTSIRSGKYCSECGPKADHPLHSYTIEKESTGKRKTVINYYTCKESNLRRAASR
ncbi:MAG: flagellar protein [Clostridia bacterium]|nr:flagellar protein [Clostridia bacterium]